MPKRLFSIQNRKNGHHHQNHHICISLDDKFHLKQTFLIFLTKFTQKGKKKGKEAEVIRKYCLISLSIRLTKEV